MVGLMMVAVVVVVVVVVVVLIGGSKSNNDSAYPGLAGWIFYLPGGCGCDKLKEPQQTVKLQ